MLRVFRAKPTTVTSLHRFFFDHYRAYSSLPSEVTDLSSSSSQQSKDVPGRASHATSFTPTTTIRQIFLPSSLNIPIPSDPESTKQLLSLSSASTFNARKPIQKEKGRAKLDKESFSVSLAGLGSQPTINLSDASTTTDPSNSLPTRQTELIRELSLLQAQVPDRLLLAESGMFMEIFKLHDGVNLEDLSTLLNIRIGVQSHRSFIGFPSHSAHNFIPILVNAGYKLAIANQMEKDNVNNKKFIRRITRLISRGTFINDLDPQERENNWLVALDLTTPANDSEAGKSVAIGMFDISSGQFQFLTTPLKNLNSELCRIAPKEILIAQTAMTELMNIPAISTAPASVTIRPDTEQSPFGYPNERMNMAAVFESKMKSVLGTGAASKRCNISDFYTPSLVTAGNAILSYVAECFPDHYPNFQNPDLIAHEETMEIPSTTLASMELVKSFRGEKRGSLIHEIDTTKTAGGARLLVSRIKAPSTNLAEINRRLDLVDLFHADRLLTSKIQTHLGNCSNIDRCLQKVFLGSAKPQDLFNILSTIRLYNEGIPEDLKRAAEHIDSPRLVAILDKLMGQFIPFAVDEFAHLFSPMMDSDADTEDGSESLKKISESNFVPSGVDPELDTLRETRQALDLKKSALASKLSEELGCNVDLISDTKHSYVALRTVSDVKRKIAKAVMKNLKYQEMRVQSNRSTYRIHVQEWTYLSHDIAAAENDINDRERELFSNTLARLKLRSQEIAYVSHLLAEIDVASSHAKFALYNRLVRPEMVEEPVHLVKNGRHPVVESSQLARGRMFVNNSSNLTEEERIWLITGSNMGGKSTFLRQTMILTIMAQAGLYIPCESAKLGIADKVFSRIGASDDLYSNQSTFMVEMKEAAHILQHATPRSLVIMDEIGRGTSSEDGACLALAIISHLHDRNQCRALFATHYHELVQQMHDNLPSAKCYHFQTTITDEGDFICTHSLLPGVIDSSHGIEVAQVAGLPDEVIRMARKLQASNLMTLNAVSSAVTAK